MTEMERQDVCNTIVSNNDDAVDLISYNKNGYLIWSRNMTVMNVSENEFSD